MTIYTSQTLYWLQRNAIAQGIPFVELSPEGLPLSPQEICQAVESYVSTDSDFKTMSPIAIEKAKQLRRLGLCKHRIQVCLILSRHDYSETYISGDGDLVSCLDYTDPLYDPEVLIFNLRYREGNF